MNNNNNIGTAEELKALLDSKKGTIFRGMMLLVLIKRTFPASFEKQTKSFPEKIAACITQNTAFKKALVSALEEWLEKHFDTIKPSILIDFVYISSIHYAYNAEVSFIDVIEHAVETLRSLLQASKIDPEINIFDIKNAKKTPLSLLRHQKTIASKDDFNEKLSSALKKLQGYTVWPDALNRAASVEHLRNSALEKIDPDNLLNSAKFLAPLFSLALIFYTWSPFDYEILSLDLLSVSWGACFLLAFLALCAYLTPRVLKSVTDMGENTPFAYYFQRLHLKVFAEDNKAENPTENTKAEKSIPQKLVISIEPIEQPKKGASFNPYYLFQNLSPQSRASQKYLVSQKPEKHVTSISTPVTHISENVTLKIEALGIDIAITAWNIQTGEVFGKEGQRLNEICLIGTKDNKPLFRWFPEKTINSLVKSELLEKKFKNLSKESDFRNLNDGRNRKVKIHYQGKETEFLLSREMFISEKSRLLTADLTVENKTLIIPMAFNPTGLHTSEQRQKENYGRTVLDTKDVEKLSPSAQNPALPPKILGLE